MVYWRYAQESFYETHDKQKDEVVPETPSSTPLIPSLPPCTDTHIAEQHLWWRENLLVFPSSIGNCSGLRSQPVSIIYGSPSKASTEALYFRGVLAEFEEVAAVLWNIWKSRNNFVFQQQHPNPLLVVDLALASVRTARLSNCDGCGISPNRLKTDDLWRPPDPGFQ